MEMSKLNAWDSLIIVSLSNPTTKVIFGLILPAVWHIFSSMVTPPTLCKGFALLDLILEPSPAARIIVCMFKANLRLNIYLTAFYEVFE